MIEHASERGRVRVERPKKSRLAGERPKTGRWRVVMKFPLRRIGYVAGRVVWKIRRAFELLEAVSFLLVCVVLAFDAALFAWLPLGPEWSDAIERSLGGAASIAEVALDLLAVAAALLALWGVVHNARRIRGWMRRS
jgi:hypothetical protein